MISDGAPVDDSTLSVNPGNYLERHLRWVIEEIETRSPVELIAIGIGHDVTRYYRRAVTIVDAEELGGAMTEKLAELFDEHAAQELRGGVAAAADATLVARLRALPRSGPRGTVIGDHHGDAKPRLRRRRADRDAGRCAAGVRAARSKKTDEPPAPPAAIEIQAQPIAGVRPPRADRRRFGTLDFRGGLVLTSPFREFGGISAINVAADGANFLAVTDRSWWLRGRITYRGTRPTGIADAEMAPMLGPDGARCAARGWYDTEAIARDGDTRLCRHRARAPDRALRLRQGRPAGARRGRSRCRPAFRSFPQQRQHRGAGLRAARLGPLGGTLIAISERGLDRDGNHLAFLIGGPRPGAFTIKRSDDFDVSDATILPGGDLVILERKFGWTTGLSIRIAADSDRGRSRPARWSTGRCCSRPTSASRSTTWKGISVHRARRRDRADADLRRQFLAAAAHAAAAVHAGGVRGIRFGALKCWPNGSCGV